MPLQGGGRAGPLQPDLAASTRAGRAAAACDAAAESQLAALQRELDDAKRAGRAAHLASRPGQPPSGSGAVVSKQYVYDPPVVGIAPATPARTRDVRCSALPPLPPTHTLVRPPVCIIEDAVSLPASGLSVSVRPSPHVWTPSASWQPGNCSTTVWNRCYICNQKIECLTYEVIDVSPRSRLFPSKRAVAEHTCVRSCSKLVCEFSCFQWLPVVFSTVKHNSTPLKLP